jgi:hypothetical protein
MKNKILEAKEKSYVEADYPKGTLALIDVQF